MLKLTRRQKQVLKMLDNGWTLYETCKFRVVPSNNGYAIERYCFQYVLKKDDSKINITKKTAYAIGQVIKFTLVPVDPFNFVFALDTNIYNLNDDIYNSW